jgi:chromatin segregation and condensation protein Rec8/ScpA/Scc1 (kleisin family)
LKKDKPFYLRPPWEILFKETKLNKVSPWSVDLDYLLTTLLEEMDRVGIDFRMAGTAINSSVLIYLKKAELLLKMEEPPKTPPEKKDVYVPPPVDLPFRFEFTTTTIRDLITALDKALTNEGAKSLKPSLPTLPVPIPDFMDVDAYLLEIEGRADMLLEKIKLMSEQGTALTFYFLIPVRNWPETVRIFMLLLFLAQRGVIDLQSDEEETDIKIVLKEDNLE